MTQTVLIVNDNETIREVFSDLTEMMGYNPITAANGQEAVGQAKQADIILMDCDMPIMDGLEALAIIRAQDKTKPIIMMTGMLSGERITEFQRLNADYLEKPFGVTGLIEKLEQYK